MAPHFNDNRSIFAGFGVITVSVIVLVAVVFIFLQVRCANPFWDSANIYPDAELIESESAFLGVQRAVYHSDDAPSRVEDWYRTEVAGHNAAQMREAVTSGDFRRVQQVAQFWTITPDTERGGSKIVLAVMCPAGEPPF